MTKTKLLLGALLAITALVAAVSTANAAEFEVRPSGNITSVSLGKVTFRTEAASIECNLTLNGNLLAGPIAKVTGTKIGTVTGVTWANCSGGNVRAVLNTPWEMTYNSILGTLPSNVTGVLFLVKNTQFQFSIFFELVNCLYQGDVGSLLAVTGRNPYTTGLISILSSPAIPYHSGPESCPRTGTMAGTFGLTPTQTITRI